MGFVPARPAWISRINEICTELERLPRPFVDRATLIKRSTRSRGSQRFSGTGFGGNGISMNS